MMPRAFLPYSSAAGRYCMSGPRMKRTCSAGGHQVCSESELPSFRRDRHFTFSTLRWLPRQHRRQRGVPRHLNTPSARGWVDRLLGYTRRGAHLFWRVLEWDLAVRGFA
jgi:hypothetical protein